MVVGQLQTVGRGVADQQLCLYAVAAVQLTGQPQQRELRAARFEFSENSPNKHRYLAIDLLMNRGLGRTEGATQYPASA
jgi:hypothetical protein